MSYTLLSERWVMIRKAHSCFMCGTRSEPPARMHYSVGIFDGEFSTTYACPICSSFMTPERWKDYDNEISEGQIWDDPDYKQFRENALLTS